MRNFKCCLLQGTGSPEVGDNIPAFWKYAGLNRPAYSHKLVSGQCFGWTWNFNFALQFKAEQVLDSLFMSSYKNIAHLTNGGLYVENDKYSASFYKAENYQPNENSQYVAMPVLVDGKEYVMVFLPEWRGYPQSNL